MTAIYLICLLISIVKVRSGQSSTELKWDSRIIEGEDSAKGRWPWMVHTEVLRNNGNFGFLCGGSLLTDTWLLTAAHCAGRENASDYRVVVGAFNRSAEDEEDVIPVRTVIKHEQFDTSGPGNHYDIAVMELQWPVNLSNPYIGLATLPRKGDVFTHNPNCWITGWGRHDPEVGGLSDVLQELNGRIHSHEKCLAIWAGFNPSLAERITQEHICVAGPDHGGCNGDSGGPLSCDVTGNGDWVVAGLTSWGPQNGCLGAAGVWVATEPKLDWLRQKVPGLPGVKP